MPPVSTIATRIDGEPTVIAQAWAASMPRYEPLTGSSRSHW